MSAVLCIVLTLGAVKLLEKLIELPIVWGLTKIKTEIEKEILGSISNQFDKKVKSILKQEFENLANIICVNKKEAKRATELFEEEFIERKIDDPEKQMEKIADLLAKDNLEEQLKYAVKTIRGFLKKGKIGLHEKYKNKPSLVRNNIYILFGLYFSRRIQEEILTKEKFFRLFVVENLNESRKNIDRVLSNNKKILDSLLKFIDQTKLDDFVEVVQDMKEIPKRYKEVSKSTIKVIDKVPKKIESLKNKMNRDHKKILSEFKEMLDEQTQELKDYVTDEHKETREELVLAKKEITKEIKKITIPDIVINKQLFKVAGLVNISDFLRIWEPKEDEKDTIIKGTWPSYQDIIEGDVVKTEVITQTLDFIENRIKDGNYFSHITADMASGKTTLASLLGLRFHTVEMNNDWEVFYLRKGVFYSLENYERNVEYLFEIKKYCEANSLKALVICEDTHLSPLNYESLRLQFRGDSQPTLHLLYITRPSFWDSIQKIYDKEEGRRDLEKRFIGLSLSKLNIDDYKNNYGINLTEEDRQATAQKMIEFSYDNIISHSQLLSKTEVEIAVFSFMPAGIRREQINLYTLKFALITIEEKGKLEENSFFDMIMQYIHKICIDTRKELNAQKEKTESKLDHIEIALNILILAYFSKYEHFIPIDNWDKIGNKLIIESLAEQGFLIKDNQRVRLGHAALAELIIATCEYYETREVNDFEDNLKAYCKLKILLLHKMETILQNQELVNLQNNINLWQKHRLVDIFPEVMVFLAYLFVNDEQYGDITYQFRFSVFSYFLVGINIIANALDKDIKNPNNNLTQISKISYFFYTDDVGKSKKRIVSIINKSTKILKEKVEAEDNLDNILSCSHKFQQKLISLLTKSKIKQLIENEKNRTIEASFINQLLISDRLTDEDIKSLNLKSRYKDDLNAFNSLFYLLDYRKKDKVKYLIEEVFGFDFVINKINESNFREITKILLNFKLVPELLSRFLNKINWDNIKKKFLEMGKFYDLTSFVYTIHETNIDQTAKFLNSIGTEIIAKLYSDAFLAFTSLQGFLEEIYPIDQIFYDKLIIDIPRIIDEKTIEENIKKINCNNFKNLLHHYRRYGKIHAAQLLLNKFGAQNLARMLSESRCESELPGLLKFFSTIDKKLSKDILPLIDFHKVYDYMRIYSSAYWFVNLYYAMSEIDDTFVKEFFTGIIDLLKPTFEDKDGYFGSKIELLTAISAISSTKTLNLLSTLDFAEIINKFDLNEFKKYNRTTIYFMSLVINLKRFISNLGVSNPEFTKLLDIGDKICQLAIEKEPNNALLYYYYAQNNELQSTLIQDNRKKTKMIKSAIEKYEKAIELAELDTQTLNEPSIFSVKLEEIWFSLGNLYFYLKNNTQSILCFSEGLSINREHLEAWLKKTEICALDQNVDDTLVCLEKIASISPDELKDLREHPYLEFIRKNKRFLEIMKTK